MTDTHRIGHARTPIKSEEPVKAAAVVINVPDSREVNELEYGEEHGTLLFYLGFQYRLCARACSAVSG